MDRIERARSLREEYESALDEAERRRAAYHHEIIKLHRSGMSLREIAEGLRVSHQRVHQIVNGSAVAERRGRRVAARAAVTALMLVGASGLGFLAGHWGDDAGPARVSPSPSLAPSSLAYCLSSPVRGALRITTVVDGRCPTMARSDGGTVTVIDPATGKIVAVMYEEGATDLSTSLRIIATYGLRLGQSPSTPGGGRGGS
ncbi:MAG: hypothetical protein ACT4PO_15475 [Actinomycetota bacterium]